jgi:hypothetical protein
MACSQSQAQFCTYFQDYEIVIQHLQAHFCTYFLQLDGAKADGRRRRSKQAMPWN